MSAWESSDDPGGKPPILPDVDKHLPDNRPADGTQSGTTNKTETRTVATRLVIKSTHILFVADDGTITATFSIVPEINPFVPIIVVAQQGYDAYTDVLGIARPRL